MKDNKIMTFACAGLFIAVIALIISLMVIMREDKPNNIKSDETVMYTTKENMQDSTKPYSGDAKSNPMYSKDIPKTFDIGESNEEYKQGDYYVKSIKIEEIDDRDVLIIKGNIRILDELGNVENEIQRVELYMSEEFQFFAPDIGKSVSEKKCKEYLEASGYKVPTTFNVKVEKGQATYLSYSD